MPDSPRWCDSCKAWGDHHTDRCTRRPSQKWDDVEHEDWCPAKPPTDRDEDCQCLRADVIDARSWARHGYEIGQRSCTWSDQGVAPDWLTIDCAATTPRGTSQAGEQHD